MDMLHAWAPMSPKGAIRDRVGEFLTKALPDRGRGEADDQSGLVYLMVSDKERWGSKVYLESSYYFQGYWKVRRFQFNGKLSGMLKRLEIRVSAIVESSGNFNRLDDNFRRCSRNDSRR